VAAVVTAGLLAVSAAACAMPAPDLTADAAEQLQGRVLEVTRAAAGKDTSTALQSLERLVEELDTAASNGDVSFKKYQSIMSAVEVVRTDLAAAQAEAQAEEQAKAQAEAQASAEASASAAASETPSPAPEPDATTAPVPDPGAGGDDDPPADPGNGQGSDPGDDPGKGKGRD
jgi:exonuclease VII small subunit